MLYNCLLSLRSSGIPYHLLMTFPGGFRGVDKVLTS
jgi:hypothetical protein